MVKVMYVTHDLRSDVTGMGEPGGWGARRKEENEKIARLSLVSGMFPVSFILLASLNQKVGWAHAQMHWNSVELVCTARWHGSYPRSSPKWEYEFGKLTLTGRCRVVKCLEELGMMWHGSMADEPLELSWLVHAAKTIDKVVQQESLTCEPIKE